MKSLVLQTLLFLGFCCSGQEFTAADLAEETATNLNDDAQLGAVLEEMAGTRGVITDLNRATSDEIGSLPFLTPSQQEGLAAYLETYGEVYSIYELQSIEGFDSLLLMKLAPWLIIRPRSDAPRLTPSSFVRFSRHQFLIRARQGFPTANGYLHDDGPDSSVTGKTYPGSPQGLFFRYSCSWYDRLTIGFAGEKDPGERFFAGAQRQGMDFYAGYLSVKLPGVLQRVTIGNFRAGFGQGLTIGRGVSPGTSPGFGTMPLGPGGISPSLSMNESQYLRGGAASLKIKELRVHALVSYRPVDATIRMAGTTGEGTAEITSLGSSGYHRTKAEIEKRNAVWEFSAGGNINYTMNFGQRGGIRTGMSAIYTRFSLPVAPPREYYQTFGFSGTENLVTGLDVNGRIGKFTFAGEISRSQNGGLSWLTILSLVQYPAVSVNLVVRNYSPAFNNALASAFGRESGNRNEQGAFLSGSFMPWKSVTVGGWLDIFRHPWLKYRLDQPSSGMRAGLSLQWQPAPGIDFSLRYLNGTSRVNESSTEGPPARPVLGRQEQSLRAELTWAPGPLWNFRTRTEVRQVVAEGHETQTGYLVSQLIRVAESGRLPGISMLLTLFDCRDYDTRIYVWEPDVLFGFSVPAMYGQGFRLCLSAGYELSRSLTIQVKTGITRYTDRTGTGSGADRVEGVARGDAVIQLIVSL